MKKGVDYLGKIPGRLVHPGDALRCLRNKLPGCHPPLAPGKGPRFGSQYVVLGRSSRLRPFRANGGSFELLEAIREAARGQNAERPPAFAEGLSNIFGYPGYLGSRPEGR